MLDLIYLEENNFRFNPEEEFEIELVEEHDICVANEKDY